MEAMRQNRASKLRRCIIIRDSNVFGLGALANQVNCNECPTVIRKFSFRHTN